MNKYILMNKNIALAQIILSDDGKIYDLLEIYNIKAFPVGIICNDIKMSNKDIQNNLAEWWQGRAIPASRQGLFSVLQEFDIERSSILAMKCFGLSLSDQYWIKPINSKLTWDKINFFNNKFSNDIGEAFFNPNFVKESNEIDFITPDNTSDGWLRKKWIIKNEKRCLIKSGSDPYRQEPFNEVIASLIMKNLNVYPYVKYDFFVDEGQGICSICDNFITENTELVSGYALAKTYIRDKNTSIYNHYLDIADKNNISNIKDFFDSMIVLDYIIANTDRHHNNFGFIRDVNTLEYLSPAPIFDSGTSLWHKYSVLSNKIGTPVIAQPFYNTHEMQLSLIKNWDRFDFSKLRNITEEIYDILNKNPLIDKKRNNIICAALKERIQSIKLYQERMVNKYSIPLQSDDTDILTKFKQLKFNLQPVYFYYKNKFVPNNKIKYNPSIDKKILKQALIDGFSREQVKKILINSPNIKSEQMIDFMYRSFSHDKDLKNIILERTIHL